MKMIKRQTWILLAVFGVLVIVAVAWPQVQGKKKAASTPTAPDASMLLDVQETAIAGLKIASATGKVVSLGRDAAGLWTLTEPKADYTDVSSAEAAVTQLTNLSLVSSLGESTDLQQFGLDHPVYTITLTLNGGGQDVVWVGSATPINNGYYVRLNGGSPQVVNKSSLDAVLQLWLNPPVATPTPAPTDTPAPTQESTPTAGGAIIPTATAVPATPTP